MIFDSDSEEELTEADVQEALDSLVEKGFLERKTMPDGSTGYLATMEGRVFMEHMDTDPSTQN